MGSLPLGEAGVAMKITIPEVKKPKFGKLGKLPQRPSELISLALDDLRKAERSKKTQIQMSALARAFKKEGY